MPRLIGRIRECVKSVVVRPRQIEGEGCALKSLDRRDDD